VRFARDVFVLGWANVAALVLNGVLSFVLPRFMTIEDFGYYRVFLLYATLAGVAHLGMLEGIVVRWAEKPENRIVPEIKGVLVFLLAQHLAILVPLCVALIWVRHGRWLWLGLALAVYIVICNCSMLGQIALQARRQFSQLAFFPVLTSAALFAFVAALQLLGRLDAKMAIRSFVIANLLAGIGVWKIALKYGATPVQTFQSTFKIGLENTRIGWRILIANVLVTFVPSLDRFFVSGTFSIREFAIYAFAGNALSMVYTVAISAARVVYPYLSGTMSPASRQRAYESGRSMVLGLWAISLLLYFPIAYLVQWILPKYSSSLPLMQLLMINSGLVCMIHILHGNYFRVNLALNRFLMGSFIGAFAVGVLLAAVRHRASLLWVAVAMMGGIGIWWIANEILLAGDLGNFPSGWIGALALWLVSGAAFLGACVIKELWLGATVYGVACSLILAFGLRKAWRFSFVPAFGSASRAGTGS
jgi:O-antigen/teichoic acid export membrane protein